MHIAEGLLPAKWAVTYYGAAGVFVAKGIVEYKKRAAEQPSIKQITGMLTAAVFIISLIPIPVPVTGTSSHPGGTPLAAILMGPFLSTLAGFVAMLFQALFFAHGGLTTLGANTLSEGVAGAFVAYAVFRLARRSGLSLGLAGGLAGLCGDVAIYFAAAGQLALAIHGTHSVGGVFWAIFAAYMPTQLPLAVLEGAFTGLALQYVAHHRPDLLAMLKVIKPEEATPAQEVVKYDH